VIHVVKIFVTHALDILGEFYRFLDILVMGRVLRKDGIVNNDTINLLILIGFRDLLLEKILLNSAEVKLEATIDGGQCLHATRVVLGGGLSVYATHLSSQVFFDHSAYLIAAGSSLAKKATSLGCLGLAPWTLARVSLTSVKRFLAMVSAVMTLQVLGTSEEAIVQALDLYGARIFQRSVLYAAAV
jgi:hypothetical protein